jgi:hypothetical protein
MLISLIFIHCNILLAADVNVAEEFTVGNIKITNASIDQGIDIVLNPATSTGTLTISLIGDVTYDVYITDIHCNFTTSSFRSTFANQVNLNGSGVSINHGNVHKEEYCLNHPNAPADAAWKAFRAGVTFSGSCFGNTGALGNDTVAVNPDHTHLKCGDTVYLDSVGEKTVTDYCPDCSENQLDNFTTSNACSGITDIGNLKTIQIK